jgi:hypothetical protein
VRAERPGELSIDERRDASLARARPEIVGRNQGRNGRLDERSFRRAQKEIAIGVARAAGVLALLRGVAGEAGGAAGAAAGRPAAPIAATPLRNSRRLLDSSTAVSSGWE